MSEPTFTLPPQLWTALQQAAVEMGVPAAQLVNQALFNWAKLHGYLSPSPVDAPALSDAEVARLAHAALERRPARPDAPLPAQDATRVPDDDEPETGRVPVVPAPEDEPQWMVRSAANLEPYEPTDPVGQVARRAVLVVNDREVPLDTERFVVGRDVSCHLTVESGRISRQHAAFLVRGETVHLEDLRSSNGTWYRGERIEQVTLRHGDEVYLGDTLVRVEFR